jgi:hypothetical protein
MFFPGQMKCLVLISPLMSGVLANAKDPDLPIRPVRELDSDQRLGRVRELLLLNWQLQSNCEKTSPTLDAALDKLGEQAAAAIEMCDTADTTCSVNFASYSAYTSFKNACIAAKGAFATYKITIDCSINVFVLSNVPVCLVSTKADSICRPKLFEDDLEDAFDFGIDECTETATNTGYTDYYASKPVKKPAKKPAKKPVMLAVRHRAT